LGYDSTPDYDWLDAQLAEAVPEVTTLRFFVLAVCIYEYSLYK
jgi:hypothetical protein